MASKDFYHPFQPYDIQQQFMEAVYQCIEQGQVGIFESPTGTGKSLSLICSSLTWLREHKRKTFDEAISTVEIDNEEPDWMTGHAREVRSREIRQMRDDFEARLTAVREKERKIRERNTNEPVLKRQKRSNQDAEKDNDENQFVLDDYDSDDDRTAPAKSQYSTETTKLMEKLGMLPKSSEGRSDEVVEELKIYFCSRTHSQLSQFVGELKRVRLPAGMPPDQSQANQESVEELKHLTLGSRKNLCINPKVAKLPSQVAINERCIELQQAKIPADNKCQFMPNKDSEDQVLDFRDYALAKIRDIEDLASLGSKLQICPYYASRPGVAPAEIVTLPYPLLLQKTARDALGISLKNHVVIIDEAHNLMNAVEGICSSQILDKQLQCAKNDLITYLQRFRNRLKGSNRSYVAQVVRVLDSLLQFTNSVKEQNSTGNIISPSVLLSGKAVDQINLAKLVRYITESKLARKVDGYTKLAAQSEMKKREVKPGSSNANIHTDIPTLMHVQGFLMALMNPSREGRFLWSKKEGGITLQYMLLDPSQHFRDIVEDARAIILAGGTMSPMDDYRQQLFPYLSNITTFSCGHLIPPSNLLVRVVSSDPNGRLEFSFKGRNNNSAIRLAESLGSIAKRVVGGMVVFFPSYGYLESVLQTWKDESLLHHLELSKAVFSDGRTVSAEETFRMYSDAVRTDKRGALLLSVVGGKLSEGINFSDDLGRCVVVIGLPYPNLDTPEWKAKMQYLDEKAVARGEPPGRASREHAENVCMRSVNQAIGRAIRHKNDWASILLFDARYGERRIHAKLPVWIKSSSSSSASGALHTVVEDLGSFFGRRLAESTA